MRPSIPTALLSAALVVTGTSCFLQPPPSKPCGDYESFALDACDRGSLAQLDGHLDGLWNSETAYLASNVLPGAFSLVPGAESINGQPMTERRVDGDVLFLSSTYVRDGISFRLSIAGCGATGPEHFGAQVKFCGDGALLGEGALAARRLTPISGEGEASHLALRSELKLDQGAVGEVHVANGHAYVVSAQGLAVVNVTNPAAPVVVAKLSSGTDFWADVAVNGNTLYVASADDGLLGYDITNPSAPVKVFSTLPTDKPTLQRLHLEGNTLYATSAFPKGEVVLFDVTNPTAPVTGLRYSAPDADPSAGGWPSAAYPRDGKLFINYWNLGMVIADIANTASPSVAGAYAYANPTSANGAVGQSGSRGLFYEVSDGFRSKVRVLDVTNPKAIAELGAGYHSRDGVSLHGVQLVGNKLYLTHYQDGLRVVDVTTPEAPATVAYFNTWRESDPGRSARFYDGALGLHVPGDGHVYVTDTLRGLMVFDEN